MDFLFGFIPTIFTVFAFIFAAVFLFIVLRVITVGGASKPGRNRMRGVMGGGRAFPHSHTTVVHDHLHHGGPIIISDDGTEMDNGANCDSSSGLENTAGADFMSDTGGDSVGSSFDSGASFGGFDSSSMSSSFDCGGGFSGGGDSGSG